MVGRVNARQADKIKCMRLSSSAGAEESVRACGPLVPFWSLSSLLVEALVRNMPLSQEVSQLSQDEDSRAAPFETKRGEK